MDARVTKEEVALRLPRTRNREAAEIEALRLAVEESRDAALGTRFRRGLARFGLAVATLAEAVAAWPARRRAYEELRALTDRELADIGLARGEIGRVFEPGFRARRPARAAAANAKTTAPLAPATAGALARAF